MQISFDSYSYMPDGNQAVKRESSVKKNAAPAVNKNMNRQAAAVSSKQTKPVNTEKTQQSSGLVNNRANADHETTFPVFNIGSKYGKYMKALQEHYSKVNEENKKFSDPEKHINDKYFNKKSPYYVTGLTNMEREICAAAEWDVYHGIPPALNNYDPVIQKNFGGCNIFVMDMEWNQDVRHAMNDAINQAFEENGIQVLEDEDYQLTVDPYDFYIHVSGVDEELCKQMEDALNKGKNGYYLYQHITYCNPANYGVETPSQYLQGDTGKMAVYHLVNKLTGYDIRELENRDGKFYTPEGEDLWEVLKVRYSEMAADSGSASFGLGNYYAQYQRIAKEGWKRSTDSNLTVGYQNGSLYDIDTSHGYGPGQTAWQDRVRSWDEGTQEQYLRKREEDLYREEHTKTKLEMAIEAGEQMNAQFEGANRAGFGGIFQLTSPNLLELQAVLERLLKDKLLKPLTNEILSLDGEHKVISGFDYKA